MSAKSAEITFRVEDGGSVAYKGEFTPAIFVQIMLCCCWQLQESNPPHGIADILPAIAERLVGIMDIMAAIDSALKLAEEQTPEQGEQVH